MVSLHVLNWVMILGNGGFSLVVFPTKAFEGSNFIKCCPNSFSSVSATKMVFGTSSEDESNADVQLKLFIKKRHLFASRRLLSPQPNCGAAVL